MMNRRGINTNLNLNSHARTGASPARAWRDFNLDWIFRRSQLVDQDTPATGEVKYPHWQREFEAAIAEGDPQTLRQRVDAAEAALFLRSQALAATPEQDAERKAIAQAVSTLRAIQKDKLNYPPWNKS